MHIFLFDDEPLALDFLEYQLKKTSKVNTIDKSTSANIEQHLHKIRQADAVFLDIEMPEISGLELAEKLLEVNPDIILVFVTAYDQYALEAFKFHALDYLLKPVQVDRLQLTLERIEKLIIDKKKKWKSDKPLTINIFNELTFQFEGESQKINIKWRTSKAKELFLYLLHQKEQKILKTKLIHLFWPDIDYRKAYAQLYVTIYHIRKTLRDFNSYIMITNINDGYVLELHQATVDRNQWESKLKRNITINEDTVKQLEELLDVYTGSYLRNNDYVWLEAERYRIEKMWIKRAIALANYYLDQNETEKAIEWFSKIFEIKPDDEEVAFQLMKIYASLNYGMLVHYHYKLLKKSLDELGLEIDTVISDWYDQWAHKHSLP
ncbi:response regulator [Gracilibacillus alcaliphilus]|uniref:response regulator n=1 Tax=Gracilibacillus alcaliphilus TaxID=1401441 RepID=UPI001959E302|nr:response regulator [Gracilibacillus alcaliphilus]MBM7677626.1 two-component SAPR family response regulator [Gracilibacillus alcaliphilus]